MKTRKSFILMSLIAVFLYACGSGGGGGTTTPNNQGSSSTDTTKPTVSQTSPASGATGVAINAAISVTFSEAVEASSVTTSTFQVAGLSGTVSVNGTTATFTPSSNLSNNTTYTVTLTTGIKDAAGNAMAANYTCSFTTGTQTDTTPPAVSSVNPANNVTGTAVNAAVTATFSETMDASTINSSTFTLKQGATPVSGTVTYSGTTATFTPSSSLSYSTTYTATVTTGVKDAAGNAMASNYSWSFTTAAGFVGTKQIGTSNYDYASGVAVDTNGNIYIAGWTQGELDGNTNAGQADIFLVKSNSAGVKQWTRQIGTSSDDRATGVAIDTNGNIYIAGGTSGGLDGNTNVGQEDIFLVKYNSTGVKQWTREIGTSSNDGASGPAIDANGNIYVAGVTWGGIDGNTNAGGVDIFLLKYDSTGAKQWTRQIGTSGDDYTSGVVIDTNGNIYIAGSTRGGLDGNINIGQSDSFLVKYNSIGVKQWTRQAGTSSEDGASGLAIDANGNIYVAGVTWGGIDGNTNAGGVDIFLIKYDSAGVKQWAQQIGTSGDDYPSGPAVDTNGNIYITGRTTGGLDGNTNAGQGDIFVVKYNSAGAKQWTRQIGTSSEDSATGVAVDTNGRPYITGVTAGGIDGNTNAGGFDAFIAKYDSNGTKQ